MRKPISAMLLASILLPSLLKGQTLDEVFRNPPQDARPLIIWQWMDGVVSREGITADLTAYSEAGLGGVQQFQVGGPMQGLICDTTQAIGTEPWKELMRHAISECQRLGLSFGTHNCPGWSSSGYPTVTPEYSMQKLVWSETLLSASGNVKNRRITLPPQPEVDARRNYYEDIAVLLMPADSLIRLEDIRVCNPADFPLSLKGELRALRILRFGHTTNGKTNEATAPAGGVGLECDKMSREAVRRYWSSYPQMLIQLAGNAVGKTFQRIEIDSYEAGGQEWSKVLPAEFLKRRGYDIVPWLATRAGLTVESKERTSLFEKDYARTGTELFTENYYGYMAELTHGCGLKLLYQPYGTGSSKPFNPINTEAIARLLPNDCFCTEFWTKPTNWGWPSVPRHTQTAHKLGIQRIYAEGFTHWPLEAWQEDPASQKVLADHAFCLGVNALMLHASAQNPWPGALPGMTFGKWGSWWTPGQTWWRSGGARMLFQYFARCQALLQRGEWVDDYKSRNGTLTSDFGELQWTHRRDGETDLYFIANPLDSAFNTILTIDTVGREPEVWLPETGRQTTAQEWMQEGGTTRVALHLDEHQSAFIILRNSTDANGPGLTALTVPSVKETIPISGAWTLRFPAGWDAPASISIDSLMPWNEQSDPGIRYFSGTATYQKAFRLRHLDKKAHYTLWLGTVKNLARVSLNGRPVAHLWKKPFCCDITPYVKRGENVLEIAVTNLWPNRMIGDEEYEDDVEWEDAFSYDYAPNRPVAGRLMKCIPDWLRLGQPRPSQHRKAVVSIKFFEKGAPLLPSGLLGPVRVEVSR